MILGVGRFAAATAKNGMRTKAVLNVSGGYRFRGRNSGILPKIALVSREIPFRK